MDLSLSPEQTMLVDTARSLLASRTSLAATRAAEHGGATFDRGLWREMARLGWCGLGATERFVETVLVCEEMGRALLASPFVATVAMAAPLLAADAGRAKRLAAGELVATVAVAEPGGASLWDPPRLARARRGISGRKVRVPFAADADLVLVALGGGEVVRVAPGSPGLACARSATLGGEPLYDLTFADTPVEEPPAAVPLARALDRGAVASFAFAVGAAERVLEMTVEHARTREQFGRPIGSFQAVAHRCVEMRSDLDALRVLVRQAAWAIASERRGDVEIGGALAYGLPALRRLHRHAHQVHGAIGFSMEHDLQLFTRRAKATELLWGPAAIHDERVAHGMGL